MSREQSVERFVRDVRMHQMTVIKDDNGYRHIRFSKPHSSSYYFDLVTWPGYLCMTGDMGTWTFSRINDMFNFFRDSELRINPGYWSEKLEAGTGCARDAIAYEWDEEAFSKELEERLDAWKEDNSPDEDADEGEKEEFADKLESVKDLVTEMKEGSYSEHDAYNAYTNAHDPEDILCDIWEGNFKSYTTHYIWACLAIVWGIQQYDRRNFAHKAMGKFLALKGAADEQ